MLTDAKAWYQSKVVLAAIVGVILSGLAAFHVVLPASWTASAIVDFLATAIPFLIVIIGRFKSTSVIGVTTQAAADKVVANNAAPDLTVKVPDNTGN